MINIYDSMIYDKSWSLPRFVNWYILVIWWIFGLQSPWVAAHGSTIFPASALSSRLEDLYLRPDESSGGRFELKGMGFRRDQVGSLWFRVSPSVPCPGMDVKQQLPLGKRTWLWKITVCSWSCQNEQPFLNKSLLIASAIVSRIFF